MGASFFHITLLLYLQGLLSKEDLHVNMCDALANLPTDLGIEAIETFSRRASSEPVRNKTGFMVGSPLEQIHSFMQYTVVLICCLTALCCNWCAEDLAAVLIV